MELSRVMVETLPIEVKNDVSVPVTLDPEAFKRAIEAICTALRSGKDPDGRQIAVWVTPEQAAMRLIRLANEMTGMTIRVEGFEDAVRAARLAMGLARATSD
jgi:hypothetical protein